MNRFLCFVSLVLVTGSFACTNDDASTPTEDDELKKYRPAKCIELQGEGTNALEIDVTSKKARIRSSELFSNEVITIALKSVPITSVDLLRVKSHTYAGHSNSEYVRFSYPDANVKVAPGEFKIGVARGPYSAADGDGVPDYLRIAEYTCMW